MDRTSSTIEVEVIPPDSGARQPAGPVPTSPTFGTTPAGLQFDPADSGRPVATSTDHGFRWSTLIIVAFIIGDSSMSTASAFAADIAMKRSPLRLHVPPDDLASSARWLINGFPATVLIWTAEEWSRLTDRPDDAQEFANGFWCALRMD